jgi:hypothetical protein
LAAALATAPQALRGDLGRRWPELARLFPHEGATHTLPWAEPDLLEVGDLRPRLQRAVAGLVLALAGDWPLLLLLHDLHWADAASLDLLVHVVRQVHGARVLVVGTYREAEVGRGHPLEAVLADLVRERLVAEISVRGLNLAGTAALIAARTGVAQVPSRSPPWCTVVPRAIRSSPKRYWPRWPSKGPWRMWCTEAPIRRRRRSPCPAVCGRWWASGWDG